VTNAVAVELKRIGSEIRPAMPGLYLAAAVAISARFLHGLIPNPNMARAISEVFIAVLLGLHVRNAIQFSARFEPGIKFALQRILRLGIILLGLRLSVQDVIRTGLSSLLLILACVTFALGLAYLFGRLLKIPPRLAALIGVGTAICGNSAIVATAPVIEARDEDVSYAVATITFFGTLAVLIYPTLGYFAGMADHAFGLWAGTAILDTSQVLAAGIAFSDVARDVATVVKLVRNTLMAPIILLIGVAYANAQRKRDTSFKMTPGKAVPWFVLAFLGMTVVRSVLNALGFTPMDVNNPNDMVGAANMLKALDEVAKFAILMALAAIGLSTDIGSVRRTGAKPLILGFAVAGALALFSLVLIRLFY
jgi:uncharacterized integral membrane protein (TIGR00698 family)